MSRPTDAPVLVSRHVDGWLVGWLAVLVWIAAFASQHLGISVGLNVTMAVYWVGAVITAAHFGLSYHLAYSSGVSAIRARPFALLVAPAILALVLAATVAVSLESGTTSTTWLTSALITSVYLATTWHYIKQVYGVGRVGAAFAGISLTAADVRVLRYGLYPLWFLGAAQLLIRGSGYNLVGYRVGFSLLPAAALGGLRALAICCAIPVAVVFAQLRARSGSWPPALLVAPYAAAFVWLGLPPNLILTLLLLAPFHALQYLAIGHRAELAVAASRPGPHGAFWWLNIFAGAACGGLLLSRWLPQLLDAHLRNGGQGPLLFAAAFFVFLNVHHYVIDASIWRSKGELVRAMVRRGSSAPAPELVRT
jgi:hypothetical protein